MDDHIYTTHQTVKPRCLQQSYITAHDECGGDTFCAAALLLVIGPGLFRALRMEATLLLVTDPGELEGINLRLLPDAFGLFDLIGASAALLLEPEVLTASFLFLFTVRMGSGSSMPSPAWDSQENFSVWPN